MKQGPSLDTRTQKAQELHGTAPIIHNNQEWAQVTSEVNWVDNHNTQWVSLGESKNRERLFVDENSAFLKQLTQAALTECKGKSIPEILQTVNNLIDNACLNHARWQGKSRDEINSTMERELIAYREKLPKNSQGLVDVELDALANEGLLVCRHRALLATILLRTMVQQGVLPPGNVRQYRSDIDNEAGQNRGTHTWAVFRESSNQQIWLCDPTWNTAQKIENSGRNLPQYGNIAMQNMLYRLNTLDGISSAVEAKSTETRQSLQQYESLNPSERKQFIEKLESERNNNPIVYMDSLAKQSNASVKLLHDDLQKIGSKQYSTISDDVKLRVGKYEAEAKLNSLERKIRVFEGLIRDYKDRPGKEESVARYGNHKSSAIQEKASVNSQVQTFRNAVGIDEHIATLRQMIVDGHGLSDSTIESINRNIHKFQQESSEIRKQIETFNVQIQQVTPTQPSAQNATEDVLQAGRPPITHLMNRAKSPDKKEASAAKTPTEPEAPRSPPQKRGF